MRSGFPRLKKSLGQHFLVNRGIARKIVDLLEPAAYDLILEIGPGGGSLTSILREQPHARLAVLEKDAYWADFHVKGGVELLGNDALEFDWHSLCSQGEWKLIGNLPYNIASPLIWRIVAECGCYERAVFMTQKEVAERICAQPDTKAYGALSVWAQVHANVKLALRVNPGSFQPPPKVDSAIVVLSPRPEKPAYPGSLRKLLQICFQQRRKQLNGIFRRAQQPALENALAELGINPSLRPENLICGQYLELARIWAQSG